MFYFLIIKQSSAQQDSVKLPFAISKLKRLSDEDLANKKEGVYLTGVPDISSDPVNGFGYGAEGSLYFSGKRSDPFFEYTPYRAKIDFILFNTTRNQREAKLVWDIPYIFDTKWRLRGKAVYEINPNLLYFGINENSLLPLNYYPDGDSSKTIVKSAKYSDYQNSLTGENEFYNTYTKQEAKLNLSIEHSYLEGKLRLLLGYEFAKLNLTSFSGNSLLQNDFNKGTIIGVGKSTLSFVQTGLIYDTRDLETNPSNGIFAELTNELSLKALGSVSDFNKTFVHLNYYHQLFPSVFKKLIFAGRIGMGYTQGNAVFFEYQDEWSPEGSIGGLGGAKSLRGYKQSRFLSRVMQFTNLELRYQITQFNFLKQHLAISGVPFFDIGGVWNSLDRINQVENYRYSPGLGMRIAWNVNTILRFDYAVSKEDRQLFFGLGHSF